MAPRPPWLPPEALLMLRRSLLLLSSLLLLPGLGCSKMASPESAAPTMGYDGGDGMANAGSAAPPEPSPAPPSREEAYNFDSDDSKASDSKDTPTGVQAAPVSTPRPSSGKPIEVTEKPLIPEATKGKEE